MDIYELLGPQETVDASMQRLVDLFAQSLQRYLARDFAAATTGFEQCLAAAPGDGPSRYYRDLCFAYQQAAPPAETWDGTLRMKEK